MLTISTTVAELACAAGYSLDDRKCQLRKSQRDLVNAQSFMVEHGPRIGRCPSRFARPSFVVDNTASTSGFIPRVIS